MTRYRWRHSIGTNRRWMMLHVYAQWTDATKATRLEAMTGKSRGEKYVTITYRNTTTLDRTSCGWKSYLPGSYKLDVATARTHCHISVCWTASVLSSVSTVTDISQPGVLDRDRVISVPANTMTSIFCHAGTPFGATQGIHPMLLTENPLKMLN